MINYIKNNKIIIIILMLYIMMSFSGLHKMNTNNTMYYYSPYDNEKVVLMGSTISTGNEKSEPVLETLDKINFVLGTMVLAVPIIFLLNFDFKIKEAVKLFITSGIFAVFGTFIILLI